MQFKIDENLPSEIAELLLEKGYDAKTVFDEHLSGDSDSILINICREENRIFVSLDTDFSDIIAYPPEKYPGIIVLRVRNQSKVNVIKIFKSLIPKLDSEQIKNNLWIVEENIIRKRSEKQ